MTRHLLAALLVSLSLAAGCGSSGRTATTRAQVKTNRLTSLSDHRCEEAPAVEEVPAADEAGGECTAD